MLSVLTLIFSSCVLLALVFIFSIGKYKAESFGMLAISACRQDILGYEKFLISKFTIALSDGPGYRDNLEELLEIKESIDSMFIGVVRLTVIDCHIFALMENKVIGKLSDEDSHYFSLDTITKDLCETSFLAPILIVRKVESTFSDRDTFEARLMPSDLASMSRIKMVEEFA